MGTFMGSSRSRGQCRGGILATWREPGTCKSCLMRKRVFADGVEVRILTWRESPLVRVSPWMWSHVSLERDAAGDFLYTEQDEAVWPGDRLQWARHQPRMAGSPSPRESLRWTLPSSHWGRESHQPLDFHTSELISHQGAQDMWPQNVAPRLFLFQGAQSRT